MTENKRAREWYLLFHDRNEGLNLIKKKPSLAHHLNISSHVQVHVIEFSEVERIEKELEIRDACLKISTSKALYDCVEAENKELKVKYETQKSISSQLKGIHEARESKLHALETENRECISRFLHEQRMAQKDAEILELNRLSDGQSRQYEQTRQKLSNCEESERELTKEYYANLKALSDENAELKGQKQIIEQMADSRIKTLEERERELDLNGTAGIELEQAFVHVIEQWKGFWMNQKQNDEADYQNYLHRAMGVDANMKYHLAKKLRELMISRQASKLKNGEVT